MDNLQNLIPVNLQEVAVKLLWEQSQGKKVTQADIILQAVLENVRLMLADELEGPYWEAHWDKKDQQIKVIDTFGSPVGQITPLTDSFIQDFQHNAPKLIAELDKQIKSLIRHN